MTKKMLRHPAASPSITDLHVLLMMPSWQSETMGPYYMYEYSVCPELTMPMCKAMSRDQSTSAFDGWKLGRALLCRCWQII